jgi:hypothetical protein
LNRRQFLFGTTGLLASLAGCNTTTTETDPDTTPDTATTATSTPSPEIAVQISTTAHPDPLPSIWTDQRIDGYTAEFTVKTSGQPAQRSVRTERVELSPDSEQWTDNSVTVQPDQMVPGEQAVTATARKTGGTVTDTATVVKATPGTYKLDVVPERNEQLRQTITEASDESGYLAQRGGFTDDDPVFQTYSSHEALSFDKLGADLVALEWRHDNDYEVIEDGSPVDSSEFIQSIGTDTDNPEIEAIKNGNTGTTWYPNGNFEERNVGYFDYRKFANADTLGEALDPLHSYLFNWQSKMTESGPISTEDSIYASVLEQAIEQKNNNNLEVHAWDFDLDEHGNGLIYGKNADGSDALRIMETVANPVTATAQNVHEQLHPLVEDSHYLEPDHDEFNRYWHPLRFGWDGHSDSNRWEFQGEKWRAAAAVFNIAGSIDSYPDNWDGLTESTVAPTTDYLQDFTETLRTYNQNAINFERLYNQSKIISKLIFDTENNHVIYGNTENPQYAVVEDDSVIEEVWQDEQGRYDDFDQFLHDTPAESMRTRTGAAASARH